jgi:hypothetical protein
VPFPTFTGDQLTAYDYINAQLGVSDLRSEYPNLAAPLDSYQSTIDSMQPASGVSTADWQAVVAQLNAELTDAVAVRNLFAQYQDYHTALFADNGARLNQLGTDADMEQGTDTSGVATAIIEGTIYTALSAIPVVGSVLGNIVQTGMNAALAVKQISPDPFEVAYSELWNELSTNFEALLTMIGQQEQTILSDWGKMQAVAQLITASGPNSLAWPASLTGDLISSSVPGYDISVMQVLLPAKYKIYLYSFQTDGDALDGIPSYAQWVQSIGSGLWCKYFIADAGNPSAYPSQQALQNDVWDNGGVQADFYQAQNGWNGFTTTDLVLNCDWAVTTITNQTGNNLTVTLISHDETYIPGDSSRSLPASGSLSFAAEYGSGLYVQVQIFDPNYSTENSVASFDVHQHQCMLAAHDIWVDTINFIDGYGFSTAVCTNGSYADGLPGTVSITVT